MANLDGGKLEATIKGLERMLSNAAEREGSEAENALGEAVEYLTELGVLGYGDLPGEEDEKSVEAEENGG